MQGETISSIMCTTTVDEIDKVSPLERFKFDENNEFSEKSRRITCSASKTIKNTCLRQEIDTET